MNKKIETRILQCKFCHKFGPDGDFVWYGGIGCHNIGVCRVCRFNNPVLKQQLEFKNGRSKIEMIKKRTSEVEKLVKYLDEHPEIAAIGGGFRIIDENNEFVSGVTPTLQNPNYVKAQLMFYCTMYNGSTMFRRNIVEKHNILYKDDCLGMEDYRFWVEYSLYGKMTNTTDALLYWRQAPTTETIKVLNNKEKEREVVFAGIQRYAIESNGFKLTEREIEVFTNSFMELKVKQENKESLKELFEVLKKMIVQAREMGKENANEIMYACRNRFLEKLKKADIWY